MADNEYLIIDGDGHIQEHDDEIREYLDEPVRSGIKDGPNFPFFPHSGRLPARRLPCRFRHAPRLRRR